MRYISNGAFPSKNKEKVEQATYTVRSPPSLKLLFYASAYFTYTLRTEPSDKRMMFIPF